MESGDNLLTIQDIDICGFAWDGHAYFPSSPVWKYSQVGMATKAQFQSAIPNIKWISGSSIFVKSNFTLNTLSVW